MTDTKSSFAHSNKFSILRCETRWAFGSIAFSVLLSLLTLACSQDDVSRTVETLNVAVLPDQSELQIRRKYEPLLEHIKFQTGLSCKLLIPKSYDQLLQWFNDKQVDMAMFGGVTYVMAHLQSKARPFVMRDVDRHFRSVALVNANNPANRLEDLKGASLAFGSHLSTSGYLMPLYFFQQRHIVVDTFFGKLQFSGAHDVTAEWVRDGKVEVGIANSSIVNEMFLNGRLNRDTVKVIWESPPFADYVWALQPDISKQQRTLIRDSFLRMQLDTEDRLLLQSLGANYYIPAGNDDFKNLAQIVQQMMRREVVQ